MPELSLPILVLIAVLAWIVLIAIIRFVVSPWLARGPRNDPITGLIWRSARSFCRIVHRPTYRGRELVPANEDHGGLIVVSNHTGSIDPFLIQSVCPFMIRWMMASEMMSSSLDWLWRMIEIIPVERDGTDTGPLREAVRHVKEGGAVGIFPEGRIVRPRGRVWPFLAGAGLVAARTKAPVLLVWITDTPDVDAMNASITTPSHARITFIERIESFDTKRPQEIADRLRQRIAEVSGWVLDDDVPERPMSEAADPFAA